MEIQNVTIEDAEELLDIYAPYVHPNPASPLRK